MSYLQSLQIKTSHSIPSLCQEYVMCEGKKVGCNVTIVANNFNYRECEAIITGHMIRIVANRNLSQVTLREFYVSILQRQVI